MSRHTFVRLEIAFLVAIAIWSLLLPCAGMPIDPVSGVFVVVFYHLVTGWAFFLARVLPYIELDELSLILAGACLAGLGCGLHFFCAWLHRELTTQRDAPEAGPEQPPPRRWRWRATLSILGIVVLLFVAGIAAVGSVHQLVWLKTRP